MGRGACGPTSHPRRLLTAQRLICTQYRPTTPSPLLQAAAVSQQRHGRKPLSGRGGGTAPGPIATLLAENWGWLGTLCARESEAGNAQRLCSPWRATLRIEVV